MPFNFSQVPVVVTHPQHVVVWEWEVVRGEVEFELLRPTGSAEGIGVDTGGVEGYECLGEPQLCRSGEASLVSTFKCGEHFVCIQYVPIGCATAGEL